MSSTMGLKKIKLGEMLVKSGTISAKQLEEALAYQQEQGGKLGDILIQKGFINESRLIQILGEQLNIDYIDLKKYPIKPDIIQKLSERIARRDKVILLDEEDGQRLVGMADPTDLVAYDELIRVLGGNLKIAIVAERDLLNLYDLVYRRTEDISTFAEALKVEMVEAEDKGEELETISAEAAPVVKLLDSIFEDAIQVEASDVHIEPGNGILRIRQRVDGVLHESIIQGTKIFSALVLRIKLIANMNISEKRLPQDGRFAIRVKGRTIDVRVAILPGHYGEVVVMRLLDQSKGILKLEQLGMNHTLVDKIRHLVHKPNGMILVTGPTGSGKTTTLYAMLSELNSPERKIITIEDPVEYVLERVNQIQVNTAIHLTFATVLRSVLRHDPDIIMVGEIRDEETAQIALRAAMTGHLVFSTLHTNDAISSAVRLIDMGAEGFLVAGALRGVLAQCLARKICTSCVVNYVPAPNEQAWIAGFLGTSQHNFTFKKGAGCSRCNHSGYRGRVGIYEFLEITPELADSLRKNNTSLFTQEARKQPGFKSLSQSVFEAATEGNTTLAEVFRVTGEFS